MNEHTLHAIHKAHGYDCVVIRKDGAVVYGRLRQVETKYIMIESKVNGDEITVPLPDIFSFARCDSRYTA